MNLVLHPHNATEFRNNGVGVLTDAISCKVVRQINGQYELTLKYPYNGIHADHIVNRQIIMAKPDPVTDPQAFRIYRINPVSKGTVTVYARHIAHDTMGIPCVPFDAQSCADAMYRIAHNAAIDCPFTFTTDKTTGGEIAFTTPKAIWNILGGTKGSILDTYGGEYDFDNFNISLHSKLGANRGVSIRYGKNLTSLEQDSNCANCYTGVYPYWESYEGDVVTLPERIIYAAGNYDYNRILPLDLSSSWDEAPTEEQLRSEAERYMSDNDIGIPDVSWTIKFIQLEQTEEYKGMALLERVLLGDTVSVIFPRMNVNATARAVKIDFDPIMERYNSVTLGKVKSNLASTIVSQNQELKQDIARKPGFDALAKAAEVAAKAILGATGGAVRMLDTNGDGKPDTLYIADNEDPEKAVKVWRWNYEGWAASSTGFNGPFKMAATLDGGFLAEFITAANLIAGTIQSRDGSFFMDLDNGILRMQALSEVADRVSDVDGDLQTRFNKLSRYIKYGDDTAITIGSGNNAITLEIDNEKGIIFKKNGVQFGLWDGENFHTGNIIIGVNERAQLGNFAFVPRPDGSLSLLKVGG